MPHFAPAIVLFEKNPRWESELKRRFDMQQVLVRPCRGASDVLTLCHQAPGSVVVADFAAGPADVLRLLESLLSRRTNSFPVVIGSDETASLEWPARELGAIAFATDCINGDELARTCRRILTANIGTHLACSGRISVY
jgi:DNA-binding NtrC family response regulator